VLAMPARRRCQLIEDASLLSSTCRPVALSYRRQYFAPCAHADPARHWRHRPDSVTTPQSSARNPSVTFSMRQCGGQSSTPIDRRWAIRAGHARGRGSCKAEREMVAKLCTCRAAQPWRVDDAEIVARSAGSTRSSSSRLVLGPHMAATVRTRTIEYQTRTTGSTTQKASQF
jgi:hypothetical protein